jgi:hypothetical protein
MMEQAQSTNNKNVTTDENGPVMDRRDFLKGAALAVMGVLGASVLAGCSDSNVNAQAGENVPGTAQPNKGGTTTGGTINNPTTGETGGQTGTNSNGNTGTNSATGGNTDTATEYKDSDWIHRHTGSIGKNNDYDIPDGEWDRYAVGHGGIWYYWEDIPNDRWVVITPPPPKK